MNEIEILKEEITSLKERVRELEKINYKVERYLNGLEKRLLQSFKSIDLDVYLLDKRIDNV
jgi:predicted RNase H-like nuclease (RuvC/YqgF family)